MADTSKFVGGNIAKILLAIVLATLSLADRQVENTLHDYTVTLY